MSRSANLSRGKKAILPDDFLSPPRFRIIIDSVTDSFTNFTVVIKRGNQKLGLSVQEISQEIYVRVVSSPDGYTNSLAAQAGVQTGDILIGINYDYLNKEVRLAEIVSYLATADDPVRLHFLRRHPSDLKKDNTIFSFHKCALVFSEYKYIPIARVHHVSASIERLRQRSLQWESGWLLEKNDRLGRTDIDSRSTSSSGQDNSSSNAFSPMPPSRNHSSSNISVNAIGLGTFSPQKGLSSSSFSFGCDPIPEICTSGPVVTKGTGLTEVESTDDVVMRTHRLRPALAILILRSEFVLDHFTYIIWVLDVKTGVEWQVRRRFREFYEFREVRTYI